MSTQRSDTERVMCNSKEQGFTMVEMIIAIVVVSVGLVSVVGISAYVSRTNSTSNAINVLAAAAQDQVDRLRTAVWSRTYTDARLAVDPVTKVGGSLGTSYYSSPSAMSAMSSSSDVQAYSASSSSSSSSGYLYTQDAADAYHATATNTPAGDLDIRWEVREGTSADMRYVTIRVVQIGAATHLRDGYIVSTIVNKN